MKKDSILIPKQRMRDVQQPRNGGKRIMKNGASLEINGMKYIQKMKI